MFWFNNSRKKILKLLGLSFLVAALMVNPSLVGNLNFVQAPSLQVSVNAQTPAASDNTSQNSAVRAENQGGEASEAEKIDVTKMVMGALAGLVLFLYGVTRMADGLGEIAGDRAKNLLNKFTTNPFAGVATGAVATTILDSSSVTIIMVIAMVSAGLLSFAQSLGVVMGSNIGTTLGAQIIAFEINKYAPIALLIGALLHFFGKTERQKHIGMAVFGIGLIFFGLDVIDDAMKPFENYQPFINWMKKLGEHPLQGAAIGALFTVLVQSSSATIGIIVTLASSGLISLPAGIALMLGAEVGTCADTLVATVGRGSQALRTGVFHLLFNIITAGLGLLFAGQLAQLAQSISFGADVPRQIANAQLIFNVLGVALFIGFTPLISRALQTVIPDVKSPARPKKSDQNMEQQQATSNRGQR